jgi:glutamate-ammonia-ligase adenylyltransferase
MNKLDRSVLSAEVVGAIEERLAVSRSDHPSVWRDIDSNNRVADTLAFVWHCSEFVATSCVRDPGLLLNLIESNDLFSGIDLVTLRAQLQRATLGLSDDAQLLTALRHFRHRHMVRIAWRDLAGWAETRETLLDLSNLADACIEFAHDQGYRELVARHGVPHGAESGDPQSLVILGMGKLGGRELNYSSDIDLVFVYPEDGETRKAEGNERVIENAEFFLRLGQRIIQLLANKTADGFVYRVDMRLRPFGDSGRMAISFDSFEDYLQQHGRDWERYAYVKARPITNIDHHQWLYENLIRPFVYRRYLDFGVFESLRSMKEMIAREVARRELQDNIKLGPGGIREIEFIVQAFQLIRGGSDRRLQSRELGIALPLLAGQKLLSKEAVDELWSSYLFLRHVENRLQEFNDEQTHQLPQGEVGCARLALAMGASSWSALARDIVAHRATVSRHFANIVFGPTDQTSAAVVQNDFDLDAARDDLIAKLRGFGIHDDPQADATCIAQLETLRESGYYRRLDETGRRRLTLLFPRIFQLLAKHPNPDITLARLVRIIEMIGGRTVYLALLHESSIALERLIELCARSQFLADQIASFPLLLDELIDARLFESVPTRAQFAAELAVRMESAQHDDVDLQIEALCHFQRAAMFRIAVADFCGQLPLMKISDRLTDLAELIVNEALTMAWNHIVARHGTPRCGVSGGELRDAHVIVVAYGKFGGIELGYGSDLDLVFLDDTAGEVQVSSGPQPIDNTVFFARLGQRLVHLLTTHTRAGRLYEVDIRLRPSGKGGLLVQTLDAFDEYQRKEAWTWEHQALLRARAVAGDASLCLAFESVRIDILRHAIRRGTLRDEVRSMRERMRSELSKAKAGQFDLKQDAGGIADLEFLTQYWMLKWCDQYPPIVTFSDNIRQLESLASGAIVPQETVDFLTATYRKYRHRMHHLSLEGGDDVIADTEFVEERHTLVELWNVEMSHKRDT